MGTLETPLVSVIIPTHGRSRLLERAIESCRDVTPGCTEVIVVPNGGDACTPKPTMDHDFQVRVIESGEANANIARNVGLAAARGQFVRFLDDDDYLLGPGAFAQHLLAKDTMADVCSGQVRILDARGRILQTVVPDGPDLASTVLAPSYGTLVTAHVYRRTFLQGLSWNPRRQYLQDVEWMHSLVRRSDPGWVVLAEPVGVWQHHNDERVSTGIPRKFPGLALTELQAIVDCTIKILSSQGRLNAPRSRAAAESLWHFAHHGFPFDPLHWSGVGAHALRLDPDSRPPAKLYRRRFWRNANPLFLEWCLLPYRLLKSLPRPKA